MTLLGLFVGGRSSRMGSPKGLLLHPESGLTLVEHASREAGRAGLRVVLVGDASPYSELVPELERLSDAPEGAGPLAGLVALLRSAPEALALACDMPFVRAAHLELLRSAPRTHAVAAARGPTSWEPFLARYESSQILPLAEVRLREGRGGLIRLIEKAGVALVDIPAEATRDWDTPEAVRRGR